MFAATKILVVGARGRMLGQPTSYLALGRLHRSARLQRAQSPRTMPGLRSALLLLLVGVNLANGGLGQKRFVHSFIFPPGAFGPFFSAGYGPVGTRRFGGHGGYHHGGYGHHSVGYGGHHSGYGYHGHSSYGHGHSGYGHGHRGYGYGHTPGFFHGGPFSHSGFGYHG